MSWQCTMRLCRHGICITAPWTAEARSSTAPWHTQGSLSQSRSKQQSYAHRPLLVGGGGRAQPVGFLTANGAGPRALPPQPRPQPHHAHNHQQSNCQSPPHPLGYHEVDALSLAMQLQHTAPLYLLPKMLCSCRHSCCVGEPGGCSPRPSGHAFQLFSTAPCRSSSVCVYIPHEHQEAGQPTTQPIKHSSPCIPAHAFQLPAHWCWRLGEVVRRRRAPFMLP